MQKVFLKKDKSCVIDLDTGIIERGNISFQLEPQIENIFVYMLKKNGDFCSYNELGKVLQNNVAFFPDRKYVTDKMKKLYKELRNQRLGIEFSSRLEDRNNVDIVICNKSGETGGYILYLPQFQVTKTETVAVSDLKEKERCDRVLADLYWSRYENLSAQKDGENKNGEVIAKIGDVYQLPLMQEEGASCTWSVENKDAYNQNILVEAPNGYGKTTFMRSIMLSASYSHRDCLTENQKEQYEKIKQFHGIDESNLFIYLECKNIDLSRLVKSSNTEWIYDTLSKLESIRINRFIDVETFIDLLKTYNSDRKLILLIDGLDEIRSEYRDVLIKKINDFQEDKEFGCYSRIIITTRPLFWQINFYGYRKYTISNKNIVEDKDVLRKYIGSYVTKAKQSDIDNICAYIINNPYLRDIVCTPAIIVWIIREYQGHGEFYESIERIIEQMMLRYNSRELTVYKDQYKRVYEEIAYNYLCLTENIPGLSNLNNEVLAIVRGCIEKIKSQGDKQFNRVFADGNKNDEELGELFFTNVALMECQGNSIKFNALTYAYHLTARLVLRCFAIYNSKLDIIRVLDSIPYKYRYYVMTVASSLAMHLTDKRFFIGYGADAGDIRFDLSNLFFEYIKDKWENQETNLNEKRFIQDAIAQMLLKYYGENVYTNCNMKNNKYVIWYEKIINVCLEQSFASV